MTNDKPRSRFADAPYDVGKGKPPVHSRFRKGHSGNPKGARKKPSLRAQAKQGMLSGLEELVTVRTAAGEARVPALVAIFLKVRNKVIESGSPRQLRELLNIARDFDLLTPEELQRVGVLVVPGRSATAEEWEATHGRANREAAEHFAALTSAVLATKAASPLPLSPPVPAPAQDSLLVPKLPKMPSPAEPEAPRVIPESEKQLAIIREDLARNRARAIAARTSSGQG